LRTAMARVLLDENVDRRLAALVDSVLAEPER
jgi:hypothetical protein